MTDLDPSEVLRLGGWDARYAVVLATATRGGVAAALVDTNGDGADVNLDQYEHGADGRWLEVNSGNCGETGSFSTGLMALAWGRVDPRATVRVEYRATRYTVEASDDGWWTFVAPSHSSDAPRVLPRNEGAG